MFRVLGVIALGAGLLVAGGCARRARLLVTRPPGVKPPEAVVRCQTTGIDTNRVVWTLGAGLRAAPVAASRDESSIRVWWSDAAKPDALSIGCSAGDARGAVAAEGSLAELKVARASVAAGLVTVEGSGFGARLTGNDGVYLQSGGASVRAPDCSRMSWSDGRAVVCLPAGSAGRYQVRVQSGGRLATAAQPIEVAR